LANSPFGETYFLYPGKSLLKDDSQTAERGGIWGYKIGRRREDRKTRVDGGIIGGGGVVSIL